jgi:hypothetical protein
MGNGVSTNAQPTMLSFLQNEERDILIEKKTMFLSIGQQMAIFVDNIYFISLIL